MKPLRENKTYKNITNHNISLAVFDLSNPDDNGACGIAFFSDLPGCPGWTVDKDGKCINVPKALKKLSKKYLHIIRKNGTTNQTAKWEE